jgi:iron complex outermembrane recepter protein
MTIMRLIIIAILSSTLVVSSYAQNGGKVSGKVSETTKVTAATISLLKGKDSAAIKFSVAGKDGSFVFENVSFGNYLVSVTAVGYQPVYSNKFEVNPQNQIILLPAFNLIAVSKSLAGVTVTSKRPLIEQKVDRTIVNVDASVTNAGTNALEVLEKSPGITVDKDGNISLKGKVGVMVMIDGRPTQLGGEDLANFLRNMTSNQMDQVEIMTNPPARYDAAGNAGIINIKTKKNKAAGYNGTVSLGYTQGKYPKTNEAFNFNYRQGKINFYSNLSHYYNKSFSTLTIQRNLKKGNTTELENYFDQRADMKRNGNSYSAKTGIDYFLTKKTTIGFALNGFTNPSVSDNKNQTNISTPAKDLESITLATVGSDTRWKSFSTNMYFRTVLDTTGKELSSDFDYMTYDSRNNQLMINSFFDAGYNSIMKSDTLMGDLPQNIRIYSGRIDYLHPLKKGAKFETGIKSSIVRTDNNAVYDSVEYGSIRHDFNRSNHFIYEENINAAYVNLSGSLSKKINVQLGLRLENTNAKGNQLTTGEKFDRQYTQLFPTAYFQYKANDKNNFSLNYGRRVRRPNYQSLNPFIRFIDRYTYSQGNPDLKPQLSDNIELSHTYKNIITTTLNYSATNDIIQMVLEQKGREAYARQANIASLRQYGIAVSANTPVYKWWTSNAYVNVFNNHFKGIVNNIPISFAATALSFNTSQQFKVSKTFTAELNAFYRSGGVEGVLRTKGRGMVAAGFSQQMFKNKGTFRFTVRDIFYTQRMDARANYGNVDAFFQEVGDSRTVNIGFTYRFSKGKITPFKKKNAGSAGEEQNRVGVD